MASHLLVHVPPDLLPSLDVPRLPRQHRSHNTWDRLLGAGDVVFSGCGFTKATVDTVTAEAKLSTGTFYRYLRDKRQLLVILLGESLDLLADELAALDLIQHPDSSIRQLVRWLVETETGFHGLWRAFQEATIQDAELAASAQKIRGWITGIVLEAMNLVGDQGRLRPIPDRPTTAHLITTLLWQLGSESAADPETMIAAASAMIYRILFADRPRVG